MLMLKLTFFKSKNGEAMLLASWIVQVGISISHYCLTFNIDQFIERIIGRLIKMKIIVSYSLKHLICVAQVVKASY